MSDSPQTCITVEEQLPLQVVAGSGDAQNDDSNHQEAGSPGRSRDFGCCADEHHRKLAVCSIICGCSCIGYKALIHSVQAEATKDTKKSEEHSRMAKKFGIISIVTWLSILAAIPVLMALISYLLTLQD